MDVAQIISSAGMPGAAAIPTSSESSVGGVVPSPLFREMFAKAALTAEFPGKSPGAGQVQQQAVNFQFLTAGGQLMNGKGSLLSSEVLAMSGGEVLPGHGDPEMAGLQEENNGNLLSRAMAFAQKTIESAQTPVHQGLSLHKGRENMGEVKGAILEGQQDVEVLSKSEILLSTDVSSQEKAVEGSETAVSKQANPQQKSADDSVIPALAVLPAGVVSEMVSALVVQNIPHGIAVGMPETSTQSVLSEGDSVAFQPVAESVREPLLAVRDVGMEQQLAGVDGKPDLLWKKDVFVSETPKKAVASVVQHEVTGLNAVPGKRENISSAGTLFAPVTAEVGSDRKTAGPSVAAESPNVKAMADAVFGGEKVAGKDHVNVARHENISAMKQTPQDLKVDGKGETVVRELPSGVTVLNPAQTVLMGRSANTTDAASLAVQAPDRGRISRPDGEARDEKGRNVSVAGEGEKIVLKKEGFSSQDNSNLSQDSETTGGNQSFSPATVSSGSFDTVIKGRMEPVSEVPREHEVSALHENILTQVREKLVKQDPSGNVSKITLKLNPHELGELQINVRLENQKMTVDITAQNPVVKEALLQNIDQLKDSLLRQNISMERFNVSSGDGGGQTFNQSFREGRQTAYQTPDAFSYPKSGYYQEDSQVRQVAFGDSKENSLVDMRF